MGFQFIHVEAYGRSAGAGKAGGHSIRSIMAEAGREDGAHPHVKAPKPPIVLHGLSLAEVEAEATAWGDSAKDARGHRLRKDGLCLLAGTISAPDDMSAEMWQSMKRDAIDWLGRDGRLLSVIEHDDEAYRHIHFYKTPAPETRFESIHPGRAAALTVKAQGKAKGDQNRAYKEAMRGFQSDFFATVGSRHGLTRLGPAKRRLTRSGWVAEQTTAKALAETIAKAEVAQGEALTAKAASIKAKAEAEAALASVSAMAKTALEAADKADKAEKAAAEDRAAQKRIAVSVARQKLVMERVGKQIEAEQEALMTMKRRGGWLGQAWHGFVDALRDRDAKAAKERQEAKERLADAKAETVKERRLKETAEAGQKLAELRLAVIRDEHRKELAESDARRVRAEMALAKHLGPVRKQPARGHEM